MTFSFCVCSASKNIMINAGVPVVPGYHGSNQDSAFLKEQADKIEFLNGALSAIYSWYPTDIANPQNQVNKIRKVAYLALTGDYRQYVEDHYAALKEGE